MIPSRARAPGPFAIAPLDAAVRVLEESEARLIDDALDGLALAAEVDRLFADLVDREPELPAHLRRD